MATTLAEWLPGAMEERGLNQRQFALRAGVSPNSVLSWMRGAQPSWENCDRIATALSVDAETVRRLAGYESRTQGASADAAWWTELTPEEEQAAREFVRDLRAVEASGDTHGRDGGSEGTEARPQAS